MATNPTTPDTRGPLRRLLDAVGDHHPLAPIPTVAPITVKPVALTPEPTMREHEATTALTKLVHTVANDIREGCGTIKDAKTWPEWNQLRALYLHYCGGVEDALFDEKGVKTALLAAAIRAQKAAPIGDLVLEAWNEYADKALERWVMEEVGRLFAGRP